MCKDAPEIVKNVPEVREQLDSYDKLETNVTVPENSFTNQKKVSSRKECVIQMENYISVNDLIPKRISMVKNIV